jgi:hypothetical protein
MIIENNKKFIFIHIQKCGGSFVREFLLKEYDVSKSGINHDGIKNIKQKSDFIFSTIRNPWDWYVSWYHGSVVRSLKEGKATGPFAHLYNKNFKEYLRNLFFNAKGKAHDVDFEICRSGNYGPYSFRFINCCSENFKRIEFIKCENLERNLIQLFKEKDIDINEKELLSLEKINNTKRKDYREYYDDESIEWVRQKDRMIVDNFGYTF